MIMNMVIVLADVAPLEDGLSIILRSIVLQPYSCAVAGCAGYPSLVCSVCIAVVVAVVAPVVVISRVVLHRHL